MKILNPLVWLRWLGQFFYAWALSIPWHHSARAIPAICLVIGVIVVAAIAYSEGSSWRSRTIDQQLFAAMEVDDFATAELVSRRQVNADPDDSDARHRLALILEEQEKRDDAVAVMEQLFREKRHVESAFWLLQNVYVGSGKKLDELSVAEQAKFKRLVEFLHDEKPDNSGIAMMFAQSLMRDQKYEQAIPVYQSLAKYRPMLGLDAAAIARQTGDEEAAERLAEGTLEVVEKLRRDDPTNYQIAIAVAKIKVFLKDFAVAFQTLERAAGLASKMPVTTEEETESRDKLVASIRNVIGDSVVMWVEDIRSDKEALSTEDRVGILQKLQAGLAYAPSNGRLMMQIADQVLATADDNDEELSALRASLVGSASPGISHFIRGTAALMRENNELAENHLEIASSFMPGSSAVLNNLAVALSMKQVENESDEAKQERLENALKIVDKAVTSTARPSPYYFETRGNILFKLGEYLKAVPDLERAVTEPKLATNARRLLADCYDQLGDKELADDFRKAVEEAEADEAAETES